MFFSSRDSVITANTQQDSFSSLNSETLEQTCNISGAFGTGPHGLTVCRSRQYLYAANSYDRSISIIDCLKGTLKDCISVGTTPMHLAFCKPCDSLYVTNYDSDSVSVIRMKDLQTILSIPVGRMPHDIHYSRQSRLVFVAENGMNCISVIDPEKNIVVKKISLASAPMHIKEGFSGRYLYTAGTVFEREIMGEVSIIDVQTLKVIETYSMGTYLTDICVNHKEDTIFVTDGGIGCIFEISRTEGTVKRQTNTGTFPSCIEYIKENTIFVGDHMTGKITKFDTRNMKVSGESASFQDMYHFIVI